MKLSSFKIIPSLLGVFLFGIFLFGFSYIAQAAGTCDASGTHEWGNCSAPIGTINLPVGQTTTATDNDASGNGYTGSESYRCITGPAWDGPFDSSCNFTPTGSWSYSSNCPTACGTPQSTQTQVCSGGNGFCSGSASSRTCSATASCYVAPPSVSAISMSPNPILYGQDSVGGFTSSDATRCDIYQNGSIVWSPVETNPAFNGPSGPFYSNQSWTYKCYNSAGTMAQDSGSLTVCASGQTISNGSCVTPVLVPTTAGLEIHHTPYPGTIYPTSPFSISWSGGSNNLTYYNAYVGNLYFPDLLAVNGTDSGDKTAVTFPGGPLVAGSSYLLKIQACNSGGCSGWVNGTTITITPPVVAPTTASISVTPTTVSANQVFSSSWSGNNTPTSYNAYIGNIYYPGLTDTVSGDLTATTIYGGPLAVGSYLFRVQACNSAGCSPFFNGNTLSVVLSTVVIGSFNANSTPNNLNLPYGGGSVTLSWATTNATSCTITGGGRNDTFTGASALNGSETFNVTTSATYNITCQ